MSNSILSSLRGRQTESPVLLHSIPLPGRHLTRCSCQLADSHANGPVSAGHGEKLNHKRPDLQPVRRRGKGACGTGWEAGVGAGGHWGQKGCSEELTPGSPQAGGTPRRSGGGGAGQVSIAGLGPSAQANAATGTRLPRVPTARLGGVGEISTWIPHRVEEREEVPLPARG